MTKNLVQPVLALAATTGRATIERQERKKKPKTKVPAAGAAGTLVFDGDIAENDAFASIHYTRKTKLH